MRSALRLPLVISGTIVDASGRTLSGQTVEAFWHSIRHADPLHRGPQLRARAEAAAGAPRRSCRASPTGPSRPTPTRACPTSSAATTRRPVRWRTRSGSGPGTASLNVAGSCCGTTPAHVAAIAQAVAGLPPRPIPPPAGTTRLSGLAPLVIPPPGNAFVNVGERTNVTGSRKFARLIAAGAEDEAVEIAREQVGNGAQLIDVNMDEAMLDGPAAMTRFLRRIAAEPDIAAVPVMVDSSRWAVIEAGLRQLQGKGGRQLDLAQGGRGGVPAPGPPVPALRRGRRGHGVRRAGPGRDGRAAGRGAAASPRAADRAWSGSRPRTSSWTPTSSPSRRGWRSTTPTPSRSSRPSAG